MNASNFTTMNNTDLEHFKTAIEQANDQLVEVEYWLSKGDTECALIKAKYLIDATNKLKKLLKKYG